jgi:uncharacterized protein YciI
MHYLLFYEAGENYAERRKPWRAEHLELLEQAEARGELLLAGAYADPIDGAAFLFQGSSPAAAEAFAQQDPYVKNGLVERWYIRTWGTVIGKGAATPLSSKSFR